MGFHTKIDGSDQTVCKLVVVKKFVCGGPKLVCDWPKESSPTSCTAVPNYVTLNSNIMDVGGGSKICPFMGPFIWLRVLKTDMLICWPKSIDTENVIQIGPQLL